MSPAAIAAIVIAIPPVTGIVWFGLTPPKVRDKVRTAVTAAEKRIERMGACSEAFKDSFTRPTL